MATTQPSLSDLVFPSASEQPNLSHLLTDLKRSNLSISNRLRSILHDAEVVRQVGKALGGKEHDDVEAGTDAKEEDPSGSNFSNLSLNPTSRQPQTASENKRPRRPLVANERCGSWYVRPSEKGASAYFKSTDGHDNAWKFSTRRLNLQLLEVIGKSDGCIIVDSTRRGKRMPDALSKTIPIWCSVLNRLLFPSLPATPNHDLFTPPQVVSPSEHAQISALLPQFLSSLKALNLDVPSWQAKLSKPLRPFWVTPDTDLSPFLEAGGADVIFEDFHPVICCTASRRVAGGELSTGGEGRGYVYVQGAGDDTENWACGLTAEVWWAHAEELLATDEGDLPEAVTRIVEQSRLDALQGNGNEVDVKVVAPGLGVCTLGQMASLAASQGNSGRYGRISLLSEVTPLETWRKSPTEMQIGLGRHKIASRNLRTALPEISAFASQFFAGRVAEDGRVEDGTQIVVACESGRDVSVAVALAISIWCFDNDGTYRAANARTLFNKDMVKVRLGSFMTAYPEANPGRASLQSVNSFLMDYRK